jgi:RNA recognition motif-containing protein
VGKRLYVGGLSFRTTENTLAEYFQPAGLVEAAYVVMDRDTGRSKGFGFVEMSSTDEALRAIELFDGREFDGRQLTVAEARPREDRRSYAPRGGADNYGAHQNGYGRSR